MPRTASFSREDVLDTVAQLFRQQGYDGTSMRDVQHATGLAPTSLYAAFGNKERLFEEALEHYRDQTSSLVDEAIGDTDRGLDAIRDYFRMVVDSSCPKHGCLLGKAMVDGAGDRAEAIVQHAFDRLEGLLLKALKAARAKGQLPQGRELRCLARFTLTLAFGLQLQARRGLGKKALRAIADQALRSLVD